MVRANTPLKVKHLTPKSLKLKSQIIFHPAFFLLGSMKRSSQKVYRIIPSTFFQVKQVTFFQSRPQEVDWAHVVSIFSGRLRGEVTTEDLGVEPPVFAAAPQWGGQTTWLLRLLNHLLSLGNCDSSSVFLIIWVDFFFYPRRSRYGIYTYTHHKVDLNVGEYSIHSSHMVMTAWRWRRLLLVWCGDCLCCTRLSAGQARVW